MAEVVVTYTPKALVTRPAQAHTVVTNAGSSLVLTPAGLFTGDGPPSPSPVGAAIGDEYLDTTAGTIYRLNPGA